MSSPFSSPQQQQQQPRPTYNQALIRQATDAYLLSPPSSTFSSPSLEAAVPAAVPANQAVPFLTIKKKRLLLKIKRQFKCVVCRHLPRPTRDPILTCSQDHIVCLTCKNSMSTLTCPKCRDVISGKIKNHHVKTMLALVQECSTFKCLNKACPQKALAHSEVTNHDSQCTFKTSNCPKCEKTFLWSSSKQDYCSDHLESVKSVCGKVWCFSIDLNLFYNADCSTINVSRYFKPVLLLKPEGDTSEIGPVDKLAFCAFKRQVDIQFALVCLEDSDPPPAPLLPSSKFYMECFVDCGYGPYMVANTVTPFFHDQRFKLADAGRQVYSLNLTPVLFANFEKKTRLKPCIFEGCCSKKVEQHVHFRITRI